MIMTAEKNIKIDSWGLFDQSSDTIETPLPAPLGTLDPSMLFNQEFYGRVPLTEETDEENNYSVADVQLKESETLSGSENWNSSLDLAYFHEPDHFQQYSAELKKQEEQALITPSIEASVAFAQTTRSFSIASDLQNEPTNQLSLFPVVSGDLISETFAQAEAQVQPQSTEMPEDRAFERRDYLLIPQSSQWEIFGNTEMPGAFQRASYTEQKNSGHWQIFETPATLLSAPVETPTDSPFSARSGVSRSVMNQSEIFSENMPAVFQRAVNEQIDLTGRGELFVSQQVQLTQASPVVPQPFVYTGRDTPFMFHGEKFPQAKFTGEIYDENRPKPFGLSVRLSEMPANCGELFNETMISQPSSTPSSEMIQDIQSHIQRLEVFLNRELTMIRQKMDILQKTISSNTQLRG
ncbi:MAG: hypothetical protein HQM12_06565 [SAR324 cluster bacterium]|nr:hypothetical protein [SAR324 cluster bacterium]